MSGHFRVGVVTSPHGIKGAVNVFPTTDDMKRFDHLESVMVSPDEDEEHIEASREVEKVQYFKNRVILKLKDVSTVEEAQKLRGASLWVSDEQAVPLKEHEFYLRDFIFGKAVDEDGNVLGTITDILQTAGCAILEVTPEDKALKLFMVPAAAEFVRGMDREKRQVVLHLIKGMREDTQ